MDMKYIKEFKEMLFEKALRKGFSDCEIYCERQKSFSVSIFRGEIEKFRNDISMGVGFRGIKDGKPGYAYTEDISPESADFIIDKAYENSSILDPDEEERLFVTDKPYPEVETYSEAIEGLSNEYKTDIAKELEKKAYEYSEKIETVNTTAASGVSEIYIANTKGMELYKISNSLMAHINVVASDGERKKTGSEIFISLDPGELDTDKLVSAACDKAITALKASPTESLRGRVIFKNEAFCSILEAFVQNFYGELAQKGLSLLKGREGTKIASELITVTDDPLMKGGYLSAPFDSEGVPSSVKTIVEKGVLKTLLYNLKSAEKDGRESTANGFRSSFKSPVSTYPTNFYINKGELSFEELLKELDTGIIITDVSGLHAGANPISGDFSLLSEGFLAEGGKIVRPVDGITCAGNFFELLKNITALSEDLKFSPSGIGSPSFIADGITVSGK